MSAAAPTASTQIPGADQYASAEVMANNAYNNALAQINKNRLNTLTQYGYTGTVDPTSGVVTGVHVDPHSMYGELQQMLHGNALADEQALQSSEDRGLRGGLAHQGEAALRYQHGADATALGTNLESALSDLQGQQQTAAENRDNALWQAEQSALDAELQSEPSQTLQQLLTGGYGGGSGSDSGSGGGSGSGTNAGGGTKNGGPTYRGERDFAPKGRPNRHSPARARAVKAKIKRGIPE